MRLDHACGKVAAQSADALRQSSEARAGKAGPGPAHCGSPVGPGRQRGRRSGPGAGLGAAAAGPLSLISAVTVAAPLETRIAT